MNESGTFFAVDACDAAARLLSESWQRPNFARLIILFYSTTLFSRQHSSHSAHQPLNSNDILTYNDYQLKYQILRKIQAGWLHHRPFEKLHWTCPTVGLSRSQTTTGDTAAVLAFLKSDCRASPGPIILGCSGGRGKYPQF